MNGSPLLTVLVEVGGAAVTDERALDSGALGSHPTDERNTGDKQDVRHVPAAAPPAERRERLAAERAARQRAAKRRRLLIALGLVTAVVATVATFVTISLTSTPAHLTASESAAPAAVVRQVTNVPASVLSR